MKFCGYWFTEMLGQYGILNCVCRKYKLMRDLSSDIAITGTDCPLPKIIYIFIYFACRVVYFG